MSKSQTETTPAFRLGDRKDINTAIILSAPGKAEEDANRPAAGQTNKTLSIALIQFHAQDPIRYPSTILDDYTIINSVDKVYYKSKNGRTEAKVSEVKFPKNIQRVSNLLANIKTVLALGKNAQLIIVESKFKGTIFRANHPSLQALNSKYKSNELTPNGRNTDRIFQWVSSVNEQ